jgi:plastocyanin
VVRLLGSFTVVFLVLAGCGNDVPSRDEDTAGADDGRDPRFAVADGAEVIQLSGARDQEHVVPPRIEIVSGSWVEFVTLDRRVHTVTFIVDSLSADAYRFLRDTGQLAAPPLLERGSRFLVDFREAPPGRYVFSSTSHGEPVYGSVTVLEAQTNR